ncbi:MAG: hypothetical protein N2C14_27345 [Planctomycetales bacterium]
MNSEQNPLTRAFELCAGLPGSDKVSSELPPDQDGLAQEARKLNAALSHLREASQVEPSPDLLNQFMELATREQAEAAGEQDDQAVTSVELFDLYSGALPDANAGSVERRLASCPEAQGKVPSISRLAAVLGWLRQESEVSAQPGAHHRFNEQVSADLDRQLAQAAAEADEASRESEFLLADCSSADRASADSSNNRPSPSKPSADATSPRFYRRFSQLTTAAAAVLAFGLFWANQGTTDPELTAENVPQSVNNAMTREDLQQLEPVLVSLVGKSLLSIETISPEEMANRHLLLDLASRADQDNPLGAAKFLIKQGTLAPVQAVFRLPLFESVAVAAPASVAIPSALQGPLKVAIQQHDFQEVLRLSKKQDDLSSRLLQVWALTQLGRDQETLALLDGWSEDVSSWPETAQVFVAGVYRSLDRPAQAAALLESLCSQHPALNFHLGRLYDHRLKDAYKAAECYRRLVDSASEKLAAYGRFGLAETRVEVIVAEDFQHGPDQWTSVEGELLSNYVRGATQGEEQVLRIAAGDPLTAAELVRGNSAWRDYQITLDFQFRARDLGRDPKFSVVGYFQKHQQQYRMAIGLEGIQFVARYPVSNSLYHVTQWPPASRLHLGGDLEPGRWYTAKFRLENQADGVKLAGKVWPRGEKEPADWLLIHTDAAPDRPLSGAVGLLATDAAADVDNIRVEMITARDE